MPGERRSLLPLPSGVERIGILKSFRKINVVIILLTYNAYNSLSCALPHL